MKTVVLKIREQPWSGRALTPIPPTERDLQLAEWETFDLTFYGDQHTCAVTRITADAIELTPAGAAPALVELNGSFGPHAMAPQTRLGVGQRLKVGTWTLDMGATWDIIVERILD